MDANILIKALTEQVKQYSEIQAERSKLKGDMFLNAIKSKQNFFFKQQEQAAKQKEKQQAQQVVQSRIGALQEGQADITPYADPTGGPSQYPGGYSHLAGVGQVNPINPLGETPTPQIGVGKEGLSEVGKPLSRKEFIFKRIQDKNNMKSLLESKGDPRAKNFELSETEKKYEADYLGTGEKTGNKKIIGMIRKLKEINAPVEDIEKAIGFEGYDIEDYSGELEGYQSFRGKGASGRW